MLDLILRALVTNKTTLWRYYFWFSEEQLFLILSYAQKLAYWKIPKEYALTSIGKIIE